MKIPVSLAECFASPVHVWVMAYSITHGVMQLAIHDGVYIRHVVMFAGDCDHFSGDLKGGPYKIAIEDRGGTIRMADDAGKFELICGRLRIADYLGPAPPRP